jgi:hypothetical protein
VFYHFPPALRSPGRDSFNGAVCEGVNLKLDAVKLGNEGREVNCNVHG